MSTPAAVGPLMAQISQILTSRPGRHTQIRWISTQTPWPSYAPGMVPVEHLRPYALTGVPIPSRDPDYPVDTVIGCAAGWTVILGAPAGTRITMIGAGQRAVLPDGRELLIGDYAGELLHVGQRQAGYLFSGERVRGEVIRALEYLPEHPDATRPDLDRVCGNQFAEDELQQELDG